jgi:hypothetical protein
MKSPGTSGWTHRGDRRARGGTLGRAAGAGHRHLGQHAERSRSGRDLAASPAYHHFAQLQPLCPLHSDADLEGQWRLPCARRPWRLRLDVLTANASLWNNQPDIPLLIVLAKPQRPIYGYSLQERVRKQQREHLQITSLLVWNRVSTATVRLKRAVRCCHLALSLRYNGVFVYRMTAVTPSQYSGIAAFNGTHTEHRDTGHLQSCRSRRR